MHSDEKGPFDNINCFFNTLCFGLKHNSLKIFIGFSSFLPMFVFLYVVVQHKPDNDMSRLFPQDV